MPRLVATVTSDIDKEITAIHKATGLPISTIVRNALKLYLKENGKDVNADVQWGGVRKSDKQPA